MVTHYGEAKLSGAGFVNILVILHPDPGSNWLFDIGIVRH